MAKLTLSREQRDRFFGGGCPGVTGEGDCPVVVGYVHTLSTLVSFRVTRIETAAGISKGRAVKTWRLHYTVFDRRDPKLLLRRTPPFSHFGHKPPEGESREDRYFDENGYPKVVPDGEAAEESHYTSSAVSAISDAGEAPASGWVDEHAKQCRLRDLKVVEDPKREAQRLREAVNKARARGLDVDSALGRIAREIDGILERAGEQAA